MQGTLRYLYRGKEFGWDFYAVQPFERLGVSVRGIKERVEHGYLFTLLLRPLEDIELLEVSVELPIDIGPDDRVFVNGFQSWTESREYEQHERIPNLKWPAKALLGPYGDYCLRRSRSKRGRFHGWTYSYIASEATITLFGSLSERNGYTLFEYDCLQKKLRVSRDCAGLHTKDEYTALQFACLSGSPDAVFDAYFQACFEQKGRSPAPAEPLAGWTSWYNHFTNVSMDIVSANLEEFRRHEIPIGLFQIDDGWQAAVGDWLTVNSKFPLGMAAVAQEVKVLPGSVKPGLWLAPFVCEKKSELWKAHRDWVLRDKRGKPVKAGYNPHWSGWFYALDFHNEEFREYLRRVFSTIFEDWGFELVKLDFLYAAALMPTPTKTRGQIMTEAMEFLRSLCKDKLILGCGVPLGPAFGEVEYCRISSDVGLQWDDWLLRYVGYRERESTINALTSTIGRRHLNGRAFVNDPDVFILRTPRQTMTVDQRMTLFRLNLALGGMALTSDNPGEYTESELSTYLSSFPFEKKVVRGVEKHGGAYLVRYESRGEEKALVANLSRRPQTLIAQASTVSGTGADGRFTLRPYESREL
ncbi:MAG: glycoside hydrolase family 36 protein [Bacillota bacterium]